MDKETAKHYLTTATSFVRWLWTTEAITTLPKIPADKAPMLKINRPLGQDCGIHQGRNSVDAGSRD